MISQAQPRFNHSVGTFTIYGIIYRLLQTALNAHTAKLYPASCRVIVNRIMSLFAHHVQNSFPGLTACGLCPPCGRGNGQRHTRLWNKPTLRHLCLKLLPKRDDRLPKKELLPPWAVFQHISSTAIILLSMYVLVLLYAVIFLSCICLSINSFYIYNASYWSWSTVLDYTGYFARLSLLTLFQTPNQET